MVLGHTEQAPTLPAALDWLPAPPRTCAGSAQRGPPRFNLDAQDGSKEVMSLRPARGRTCASRSTSCGRVTTMTSPREPSAPTCRRIRWVTGATGVRPEIGRSEYTQPVPDAGQRAPLNTQPTQASDARRRVLEPEIVTVRSLRHTLLAAALAGAVLVVALQPHHHSALSKTTCVACAVRAQPAVASAAPVHVGAPVLLALAQADEDPRQPQSPPAPTQAPTSCRRTRTRSCCGR